MSLCLSGTGAAPRRRSAAYAPCLTRVMDHALQITRLDHLVLTVAFYERVLGMEPVAFRTAT